MRPKIRWFILLPLAALFLVCGLSGLALGQGPVLTSLPTPTPARPGSGDLPAEQAVQAVLPDLVVEQIQTIPSTPRVGQPATIVVTIKNLGPGPVRSNPPNNFLVDLYIDPPVKPIVNYRQIIRPDLGLPWGAQWFYVPVGQSYQFSTTWVFTDVKTFDIWAQVDSGGDVVEANEDNNTRKTSVSVLTDQKFTHDSHQDFMTHMASTLDNSDPTGLLRLGTFVEPPFFAWPFTGGACEITSSGLTISDYNMTSPDTRINQVATGSQVQPKLIANGAGLVAAVWEDGRHGEILDQDIYLRFSSDYGATWQPEIRVNDDPAGNDKSQTHPVAALSNDGNLLVAWQDNRNGPYDVYAQRFILSGNNLVRSGSNLLVGGQSYPGNQINPDIAVDEAAGFHVTWQDNRDNNYNIYVTSYKPIGGTYTWTNVRQVNDDPNLTQQSNPAIEVIDWLQVTGVTYDVGSAPQYEITNIQVLSRPVQVLAVIWEDYRHANADIAVAVSNDGGETFGFDDFINKDLLGPGGLNQLDPDVALTKDLKKLTLSLQIPGGTRNQEVEIPVTGIHTVWQDYRNSTPAAQNPDIYYSLSQLGVVQIDNNFFAELTVGGNEKINQNDARAWQTAPVIQREPSITAALCDPDGSTTKWNQFIAWSDGRNYDSANYDLYFTVKSNCGAGIGANRMLNDGVRLPNFDVTKPEYDDYDRGSPPPAKQTAPTIAADIRLEGSLVSGGYLYLAWVDDRAGNPQKESDIYFARSNLTYYNQAPYLFPYGAGSQVSNIFDSGNAATTWYTVDWSAATNASTYVTVQTRLGNSVDEVLNGAWHPQRFPFQPQPGDCLALNSGAPLPGYNAPGQHIEDSTGRVRPQARYIQYRVNFYTRDETKTPELYNLTLYYYNPNSNPGPGVDPNYRVYLPLTRK